MTENIGNFLRFCDMPEISQLDSYDERLDEFMADFGLSASSPEVIEIADWLAINA